MLASSYQRALPNHADSNKLWEELPVLVLDCAALSPQPCGGDPLDAQGPPDQDARASSLRGSGSLSTVRAGPVDLASAWPAVSAARIPSNPACLRTDRRNRDGDRARRPGLY